MSENGARYVLAVRALCEFTAKRGDLDRRFTPAPSAQEGMRGHQCAAARRGGAYQKELRLSGEYGPLSVRGRADGYDPDAHRLDECKTFRGDLARMPANHRALHWAQLQIYGSLLCERDGKAHIDLALVYFDIDTQQETILQQRFAAAELKSLFDRSCAQFAQWARRELEHRDARNAALARMAFPHAAFHSGQRDLAVAVYRAAAGGHCLLAQAPTGIGKTVGTLFPLLKAMAREKIDKIFYLAAKSTGRRLAIDALRALKAAQPDIRLRILDLVAREKACLHPDKACHAESCPLAKGFYDKLGRARAAALNLAVMDQDSLAAVAAEHRLCPYYLSQEMARWSDVVVGDYNYYFADGGLLHGLMTENQWRAGVLVDEAHNLLERARQMNSAALVRSRFDSAMRCAPSSVEAAMRRAAACWDALCDEQTPSYAAYATPPEPLLDALHAAVARLSDHAVEKFEQMTAELREFFFAAIRFCRLADAFAEHSLFDLQIPEDRDAQGSTLSIRNVIPAAFLRPRFAAARCAVLFSGTLNPQRFYRHMLGMPQDTRWLDVPSPFRVEQLAVRIVRGVSTRLRDRDASLTPICRLIAHQYAARPGNYLVFASSFDYLDRLAGQFAARHAEVRIWMQRRSMSERERGEFVDRFVEGGCGIGFAVLGGAFAEGIDLPGERLIGAFITTLGMPQVNAVNEEMMKRMQAVFGAGHEYAYLFPGLRKIAQAGGRIIRSASDRGTLYLIDDRYGRAKVREQLPGWWNIEPH